MAKPGAVAAGAIFCLVNLLFIVKYAARIWLYLPLFLCPVFILLAFLAFYCMRRIPTVSRIVVAGVCSCMVLISILLLLHFDRYATRVDRWSALSNFLDYLLAGKYPYEAQTHLMTGNHPSPLPFWYIWNFPFYLAGDVGYLQPFMLLLVTLVGLLLLRNTRATLLVILMLAISPAYWYEVVVRSDHMSNMIAAGLALMLVKAKTGDRFTPGSAIGTGVLAGALLCTRTVVGIPLILYFVHPLLRSCWREKSAFALSAIVAFAALLLPFVFWPGGKFWQYNPFLLQSSSAPLLATFLVIASAFALSLKIQKLPALFLSASMLLFILVLLSFVARILSQGMSVAFWGSSFDICYFNNPLILAIFSPFPDPAPSAASIKALLMKSR